MINSKTTAAGIAAVAGAAVHLIGALVLKDFSTIPTDLPLIILGIGHIFAADA